jgi:nucleotide-binding universal stress UspA family protein
MFKHILVPIDGSELSEHAVKLALELATLSEGRIYAFHVVQPFNSVAYAADMLSATETAYNQNAIPRAEGYIEGVRQAATNAGITVDGSYVFDERPYQAIVDMAKEHHCDLIVMASHGWRGISRLLLGSETHKVLLHSDIPVLVCR